MLSIFGNASAPNPQWQPEPDGRGTASLLQTCLLTILLCVYNSIHLNIPPHKDSEWRVFYEKSKFVMLALFAPEIITYFAWAQRMDAKAIANALNKAKGYPAITPTYQRLWQSFRKFAGCVSRCFRGRSVKDTDVEIETASAESTVGTSSQNRAFTLTHGFFILMGGLAFDQSEDPIRIWPKHVDRMTIDPGLVIACFENRLDKEIMSTFITEKSIKDKSKADRYAKTFVCLQALWFCLQFFTRIAQNLPVSLIELNTLAHSLCALMIYVFWWSKPLDILEPMTVPTGRSERTRALCASASIHSCVESYWSGKASWLETCQNVARRKRVTSLHHRIEKLRAAFYYHAGEDASSDTSVLDEKEVSSSDAPMRLMEVWGMNLGKACRKSAFLHYETGHSSSNISFEGLDLTSKDYHFVLRTPPVILLKEGDEIPGTPYKVGCKGSYELDEITLRRLIWASKSDLSSIKMKDVSWRRWPLNRRSTNDHRNLLRGRSSQLVTGLSLHDDILPDIHFPERSEREFDQMDDFEKAFGALQLIMKMASIRQLAISQNLAIIISGLLYGGIQALAIGIPLHSPTESLLWKVSTLTVAGGGLFFVTVMVLCDYIPYLLYRWGKSKNMTVSWKRAIAYAAWIFYGLCFVIGRAAALLYILARIFLVVEVFLDVPWAPSGVYQTPNWSLYMPHLT